MPRATLIVSVKRAHFWNSGGSGGSWGNSQHLSARELQVNIHALIVIVQSLQCWVIFQCLSVLKKTLKSQLVAVIKKNIYMGISKNRGTPKWMVYNGKPYENGWFGGTTILHKLPILPPRLSLAFLVTCRLANPLPHSALRNGSQKPQGAKCHGWWKKFLTHTIYTPRF